MILHNKIIIFVFFVLAIGCQQVIPPSNASQSRNRPSNCFPKKKKKERWYSKLWNQSSKLGRALYCWYYPPKDIHEAIFKYQLPFSQLKKFIQEKNINLLSEQKLIERLILELADHFIEYENFRAFCRRRQNCTHRSLVPTLDYFDDLGGKSIPVTRILKRNLKYEIRRGKYPKRFQAIFDEQMEKDPYEEKSTNYPKELEVFYKQEMNQLCPKLKDPKKLRKMGKGKRGIIITGAMTRPMRLPSISEYDSIEDVDRLQNIGFLYEFDEVKAAAKSLLYFGILFKYLTTQETNFRFLSKMKGENCQFLFKKFIHNTRTPEEEEFAKDLLHSLGEGLIQNLQAVVNRQKKSSSSFGVKDNTDLEHALIKFSGEVNYKHRRKLIGNDLWSLRNSWTSKLLDQFPTNKSKDYFLYLLTAQLPGPFEKNSTDLSNTMIECVNQGYLKTFQYCLQQKCSLFPKKDNWEIEAQKAYYEKLPGLLEKCDSPCPELAKMPGYIFNDFVLADTLSGKQHRRLLLLSIRKAAIKIGQKKCQKLKINTMKNHCNCLEIGYAHHLERKDIQKIMSDDVWNNRYLLIDENKLNLTNQECDDLMTIFWSLEKTEIQNKFRSALKPLALNKQWKKTYQMVNSML